MDDYRAAMPGLYHAIPDISPVIPAKAGMTGETAERDLSPAIRAWLRLAPLF